MAKPNSKKIEEKKTHDTMFSKDCDSSNKVTFGGGRRGVHFYNF